MTERLYYEDAYLCEFDARVLEVRDGAVRLDRSAFYPTSGGQPHDTGTLGGANVTDVYVDDAGEVWHIVDVAPSVGAQVHGQIDWTRRFDHMQQHAGEHMLAYEIYAEHGGETIGLHLGAEISTIDVRMPEGEMRISPDEIARIERRVNQKIQSDIKIRCWFPDAPELDALPLRKPPAVKEHVRIVNIGDEFVACGGTHPGTTGQIGCVKVVDVRPSRGKMRVAFVCGMRAYQVFCAHFDAAKGAAERLSVKVEDLIDATERIKERDKDARAEITRLSREMALSHIEGAEGTPLPGGGRLFRLSFQGLDALSLREIAQKIISGGQSVALLEGVGDSRLLAFARSEDLPYNMGALLSECARAFGGKGGGKPDFAQGSAEQAGALAMAEEKILLLAPANEMLRS